MFTLLRHAHRISHILIGGIGTAGHAFRLHQASQVWFHSGRAAKHTQSFLASRAASGGLRLPKIIRWKP